MFRAGQSVYRLPGRRARRPASATWLRTRPRGSSCSGYRDEDVATACRGVLRRLCREKSTPARLAGELRRQPRIRTPRPYVPPRPRPRQRSELRRNNEGWSRPIVSPLASGTDHPPTSRGVTGKLLDSLNVACPQEPGQLQTASLRRLTARACARTVRRARVHPPLRCIQKPHRPP